MLRPGGWLGMVWNGPAPHAPWEIELAQFDPNFAAIQRKDQQLKVPGLPAEELQTAAFPWTRHVSAADVRAGPATHSAYAIMDSDERASLGCRDRGCRR